MGKKTSQKQKKEVDDGIVEKDLSKVQESSKKVNAPTPKSDKIKNRFGSLSTKENKQEVKTEKSE